MGCVYLLHFSVPIFHAQHYVGYADHLKRRLNHHRSGSGARLTQVAVERGIELQHVRTWEDKDRSFERKIKKTNNGRRLCPICNPKASRQMKG